MALSLSFVKPETISKVLTKVGDWLSYMCLISILFYNILFISVLPKRKHMDIIIVMSVDNYDPTVITLTLNILTETQY